MSCHNILRPGTNPEVVLVIDLDIANEQWPKLRSLMSSFATNHALSFRDESEERAVVKLVWISACTEEGLTYEVNEQRWKSENYENGMKGRGVVLHGYVTNPQLDWRPLSRELVADFEESWPGKVRFRDEGGHLSHRPKELDE